MLTNYRRFIILCVFYVMLFSGCEDFLDEKSDMNLAVPSKISDLQSLMDNYQRINAQDPACGEISSDDLYVTDAVYNAISSQEYKDMYVWRNEYIFPQINNEWKYSYDNIYIANTALSGIEKIDRTNQNSSEWSNVKGQAFFLRGKTYFNSAQIWCVAYNLSTADKDMGLPLRLNDDFNENSVRASIEQTYRTIIHDLKSAVPLLPKKAIHVQRASKPAAYGMLARTFLAMRDYENAGLYADSCLQLFSKLMDYNTLDSTKNFPIERFNEEVIYNSWLLAPQLLYENRARIPRTIYDLYNNNDLRKAMFFKKNADGTIAFKGGYGGEYLLSGIAADEMVLIRAESLIRANKIEQGLEDLNRLLTKRFKTNSFVPYSNLSRQSALEIILLERRKELIFRGLRWMDIRRLNLEGANINLNRTVNGIAYQLNANSNRFALPIPEEVIKRSGIPQNSY